MTMKTLFRDRTDSSSVQLLRSVLVSNVSFLLDFGLCLLLVGSLKLHYVVATLLSFTAGSLMNYALSILWVFDGNRDERRIELVAFLAVSFIGLGLNALGMYLFTGLLHLHYLVSRVAAATLVFFFNYACKKHLVFGILATATLGLAHRRRRG